MEPQTTYSGHMIEPNKLRTARATKGWTRRDLSEASGVKLRVIEAMEQGRRTDPAVSLVQALARALGVPIEELLSD